MKILETHNLTIKQAVKFSNQHGVMMHYSALQGMMNKIVVRNNVFTIPGKPTQYLRFNKAQRGCIVEICEINYE